MVQRGQQVEEVLEMKVSDLETLLIAGCMGRWKEVVMHCILTPRWEHWSSC